MASQSRRHSLWLAGVPVVASVVVNQYLIKNPEMRSTLILLSTLAIAGCVWGTGASLGTAAAATIQHFCRKIIFETATDFQPTGTTGGA
ncbi:MAG: hypothetical protein IPL08_08970 [Saprospiraceae bacterium]|nr:hypothetical protein [Saprospiraceae bacterium]